MPKFSKHFCSEMDKSVFWMAAPHLRAYATHKCSRDGRKKWKWKIDDCVGLRFAAAVVVLSDYCAHGKISSKKAEDILSRLDGAYRNYSRYIQHEDGKKEALKKLREIVKEIPVLF